jgi:hypothetical protein
MEEVMANHNPHDQLCSLWQGQTLAPFQMSPDELRQKMKQLNKQLKMRDSVVYVICLGEIAIFTFVILVTSVPATPKIGLFLLILAMGFLVGQIWLDRNSRKVSGTTAAALGKSGSVDFYRVELVRQRNFHRGVWFWSRLMALLPGLFVCDIWLIVRYPKHPMGYLGYAMTASLLIISPCAVWMNWKKSLCYQRQIDALDALKQAPE